MPSVLSSGPQPVDRAELAAALATANAAYGHPRAEELAVRLADPQTRVVVSGQQPGLFGGPLLALTKLLAAVLWAETLERQGEKAVAVFWVATEDHDWAELSQTALLERGELRTLALGADPAPLMPVGMRTFGTALNALDLTGWRAEQVALIQRFYRPDARFGEAFARLLVALVGERAPLFRDAMLPSVMQLDAPWLRLLVERRSAVSAALASAEQTVLARGFELQVTPQPGTSPLFLLHGQERRRIVWDGADHFTLRGVPGYRAPVAQLLTTIAENPTVISPGVLARPALQDALLATTLQVMGPAEIAYLAQAAAVYSVLAVEAPWTTLRPQALLLEATQQRRLSELGITLEELLNTPLVQLLSAQLGGNFIAPVSAEIEQRLSGLGPQILALDKSLETPWRKTCEHVARALEQLSAKVVAAIARQHEVQERRLAQLQRALLPGGKLQERTLGIAHFLGRHGPGFVAAMLAQMQLDPRFLQVILLDSSSGGEG